MPTKDAIQLQLGKSPSVNEHNFDRVTKLGLDIFEGEVHTDLQWLLDTTEAWCQERAIHIALMDSIEIFQGNDANRDKGAIPSILQDALSVTFNNSIGHDYLEDAEKRYEFYHRTAAKIPFDLDSMNQITGGGFEKKSMNVIMAGPGVGKSMFMCHVAAAAISQGYNVLYVTLEMAEEKISERIDANLMGVDISRISKMSKNNFIGKIQGIASKTHGTLIVKQFPTASANINHIRALTDELAMKKKFKPDLVIIDYLNIMTSSRLKMGGSVNSYSLVKAIAEEVRGFAVEMDLPVMTATQVNREGYNNSDIDLENTSESFGLPATADFMMALMQTEEMAAMGQFLCKQLKNRYNDMNTMKRFMLGVDKARMRLYDLDSADTTAADTIPKSSDASSKPSQDYSGFKV